MYGIHDFTLGLKVIDQEVIKKIEDSDKRKATENGVEITVDQQWERVNMFLAIFAVILLINSCFSLVLLWNSEAEQLRIKEYTLEKYFTVGMSKIQSCEPGSGSFVEILGHCFHWHFHRWA